MLENILIIDNIYYIEKLKEALRSDYLIFTANSIKNGLKILKYKKIDAIISDIVLDKEKTTLNILDKVKNINKNIIFIFLSEYPSIDMVISTIKRGAFYFLKKPINIDKLKIILKKGLILKKKAFNGLLNDISTDKNDGGLLINNETIIGNTKILFKAILKAKKVAKTKSNILILGESGTGKELFAKLIHQSSIRHSYPFIIINCASLPINLIESELFGHEKGSFTGANDQRIGRFEYANQGSIFLDEIGEINEHIQIKLLRFLETKTIERIGNINPILLNVRLIFATNKNLNQLIKEKQFRLDLYHRLNIIKIHIPSLRNRKTDIPLLLNFFIQKFSDEYLSLKVRLSTDMFNYLKNYNWPGNIRELKNICEYLSIIHKGKIIKIKKFLFFENNYNF